MKLKAAYCIYFIFVCSLVFTFALTLYRMVMPIGTPFLKEKINN